MVFLGTIIAFKEKRHIVAGINLSLRLPSYLQKFIFIISSIIIFICLLLFSFYGYRLVLVTIEKSGLTLPIPMFIVWLALPLSSLIILFLIIYNLFKLKDNKKKKVGNYL